ncbi:hypothetical protein ACSBOB_01345 [Mesorhizobium sp. ASY16-5R]|uniref:hypothetical protein n=1 Tax=Mesorhizobium sp. ASY16-5R TaxID=3445772 RepID=UPI003FA0076C
MEIVLYAAGTVAAAVSLFVSATLFRAGFTHLVTRADVQRDAEAHSPASPGRVIKGEVDTYKQNEKRDASVAAGMARDRSTNRFVLQGRVSDEVLETLV